MEVQDGMLETVGRMVNRMAELKGMATQDPMKSDQDVESYNNEFHDLQQQLYQISQQTFNGASLFADRLWIELEVLLMFSFNQVRNSAGSYD